MNERSFTDAIALIPRPSLRGRARLPGAPERPAGTRRKILETALQMFATRGYAATSIRDLAGVVELQPSALYAHFRSKEHVLAEIAEVGHAAHEAALKEALDSAPANPVARMRALARAHALMHAHYPHIAVVVNQELYSLPAKLAAPAVAIRARATELLLDVLRHGVAEGVFDVADLTVSAGAIAAMSVRIPYWYAPDGALAPEALADEHATLALRILGVRETR